MKVYSLHREQRVALPLELVFRFFQQPENLQRLTPPDMGFSILTPLPLEMKEGALIDYTITIAGMPVRWTTLITSYEPPHVFVDQQLRGPYSFWHHTHRFTEIDGRTLIEDEVRYALPFGFLGTLAHYLVVRKMLDRIFLFRSKMIEALMFDFRPGSGGNAG
jgi:ligand-binding SRPBCC domain-containing protein